MAMLCLSLPSHECHYPGGSTSMGPSMSTQEELCGDMSVEGAPSRRVGVRQVLDARHTKTQQGNMDHQLPSREAPSNARGKAKRWTKFQALQETMDSFRRKKINGQDTFQ